MEEKSIYEVRVECRAVYTALVKAGSGQEAITAAEELAAEAAPIEFDIIWPVIGSEVVRKHGNTETG